MGRAAVRAVGAAALSATTLLAACAVGEEPAEPGQWRLPEQRSPEITLAFGGDVHFVAEDEGEPNRTGALLAQPATAFGPVAELFTAADLSMINLETAVTTGGTPEPKTFLFRAPPETFDAVAAAGIDAVSLANNHALDYGRDGLADTLAYAAGAGVTVVGAGDDADAAYAPWLVEIDGVQIAVLGMSQVWELWDSWRAEDDRPGIAYVMDEPRAMAAVREAREVADVVVVYLHWGQEGNPCPTEEMAEAATALSGAGADLLVGTHAHLLLGDGWLGETYVHYGLGNFLWWRDHRFSNDTGVLWVTLRGSEVASVELKPAVISQETGQPIPVDGSEAQRIRRESAELRDCTGLSGAPVER